MSAVPVNRNREREDFLAVAQAAIDRYEPMLASEFSVALGRVIAKPLNLVEFLDSIYLKAREQMVGHALRTTGRAPNRSRLLLLSFERMVTWVPAYAFCYLRFWYPSFIMKWSSSPPAVIVSFLGWSEADFEHHRRQVDQFTLHELGHGVWNYIARDELEPRDRTWRLWNEGFAHYLADIQMRHAYPADAEICQNWSEFRLQGRHLVAELVRRNGEGILQQIPRRWREFDAKVL